MLVEIFSLEFMRMAAVAGVAAGVTLSVLGVYVVLKRVVFVHSALVGHDPSVAIYPVPVRLYGLG